MNLNKLTVDAATNKQVNGFHVLRRAKEQTREQLQTDEQSLKRK